MKKILLITALAAVAGIGVHCSSFSEEHAHLPETNYEQLSDYHFFTGALADLQPNDRVIPYDLNTPLFSDYAHKARFVWMPEGSSANYTAEGVLAFPEGTVLIKNFYYERDEREPEQGRRVLETRLLIHRSTGWEAVGYIWDDAQTEAYLEVIGDIKTVNWTDKTGLSQDVDYIIPNKNQCKSCHAREDEIIPIGPKVQNLNKSYPYATGTMNQLEKWSALGYLSGYRPEDEHPQLATWNQPESGSLHDRALAYLDVNCGHCHYPQGAANTSGLSLTAHSPTNKSLGIYKPTVSAGAGTGGHTYSIVPGQPENSIMVYRMNATDPGAMMPELGRRLVHREGVALISEWIRNMEEEAVVN